MAGVSAGKTASDDAVTPRWYGRRVSEALRAVERIVANDADADVVVRTAHPGVDAYVGAALLGPEEREARLVDELAPGATRPVGAGDRIRPEEADPYRLCFE